MAVTITSIADNDLRVFGGIPMNENMYTMGQVETRLSGVTANVAEMISTAISTVWKAGGSVDPVGQSGLVYQSPSTGMWEAPLANAENEGKVYHVTSGYDITSGTASFFKEGVGTHIEAGTDVAVVYSGKQGDSKVYIYDVLAVTDSSVVKSLRLGTSSGTQVTPENGVAVIPMAEAPVGQGNGSSGLMSAALAEKLSGISCGAEVNQNAFSSVAVQGTSGSSTVTGTASAGSKTDTVTLKAGNNVSMAVSGKVVTINASQPTDVVAGLTLHDMLEANGFTTSGLPSTIESGTLYALISGLHSIDNQHS